MTEINRVEEAIEMVVTKIFYSPATNGQAEESIKAGIEDVKKLLAGYSASNILSGHSELPQGTLTNKVEVDIKQDASTRKDEGVESLGHPVLSISTRGEDAGGLEAIEFAEWIAKQDLKMYADGWCQPGGSNGFHYSTSELYKLFNTASSPSTREGAKHPYDYQSIPLKNVQGSATYTGEPSEELIDAVNQMAETAFTKLKKAVPTREGEPEQSGEVTENFTNRMKYSQWDSCKKEEMKIGCSHWFNTLIAGIMRIGEYMILHPDEKLNAQKEWGETIQNTAKDMMEWFKASHRKEVANEGDTIEFEFAQWASHSDWTYLPSKKLWYNEEEEENITPKTTTQLYVIFKQKTAGNNKNKGE